MVRLVQRSKACTDSGIQMSNVYANTCLNMVCLFVYIYVHMLIHIIIIIMKMMQRKLKVSTGT